jgi:hypothetical protein
MACQEQKLQLITNIRKLRAKKFYNIGPWGRADLGSVFSTLLVSIPGEVSVSSETTFKRLIKK